MRKKLFFFNSDFRAIVRKPSVVAQSHRRHSLLKAPQLLQAAATAAAAVGRF